MPGGIPGGGGYIKTMKKKIQTSRHVTACKFHGSQRPEIEVTKAKLIASKRQLNKAVTSKYDGIITTSQIAVS